MIARRHFGGAGAWAAILAVRAAGFLIGGTTLLRLRPGRPLLVATLACATVSVPVLLLAVPAPLALIIVGALIAGVGSMVSNTLWETTLQGRMPPEARSRVSSYDWFGSIALQPLGYVLVGPLAGAIGVSAALYVCASLDLAVLATLLGVRDIRRLGPLPDQATASA